MLDHYLQEEIYARADQIDDRNNPLHAINEVHYRAVAVSFCNQNYNYAHSLIIVYVSSSYNPEGATYSTAEHNIEIMKWLENGYCMVNLVGCNWSCSIKMIWDEDAVEWATKPLRMLYEFGVEGKAISSAMKITIER